MKKMVRLVEEAQALESLRSSDFDALSAYGEVIDNAIQAEATNINIQFDFIQDPRFRQIRTLAFADNGCGMDAEVLQSCLRLGWSSRFNDRSGIGRFGVGMILGAIHEVKRIEVYSKKKGQSNWLYTYVDLDEIASEQMVGIPEPVVKKLPEEFADLVVSEHGTVVLWKKYDRQKVSAEKIIKDAHHWVGRTFRHFIWDGLEITINRDPVMAHDPLFLRTEKTRFPDDPKGTAFDEIVINWPVSDPEVKQEFGETGEIKIKMSLLPEKFRPTRGSGGNDASKLRNIQDLQEGVSILRERREVFFGQIPYWSLVKIFDRASNSWAFIDKDRWWGCEISFGAELDSSFEVRNIKRGANPEAELKRTIKEMITPTRNDLLKEVDKVWDLAAENEKKKQTDSDQNLDRHQGHSPAEKAATLGGKGAQSKLYAKKSPEEVADELMQNGLAGLDEKQKQRYLAIFSAQDYIIIDNSWRGSNFWEVTFGAGKIAMEYNTSHEFIRQLKSLEDLIATETDPERLREHATQIITFVDLLLVSLAKAQSSFEETEEVKISQLIEELNAKWGMLLKSFTSAWIGKVRDEASNDG